jgi:Ca-activated chloride channel family protein
MRYKKFAGFALVICLFLFGGNAWADYVTLEGKPVTQGHMLIASNSMEELESAAKQSVNTDRFILKKTNVEVEITGAIARVRVQQLFNNPYSEGWRLFMCFQCPKIRQ